MEVSLFPMCLTKTLELGRSSSSTLNEDFMELEALRGNNGQVILEWNVLPQYTLGKYKRIYAAHSGTFFKHTV